MKAAERERMKWFVKARFGMFIHWGVYSVPASGECITFRSRIPHEEYRRKYAHRFRAERYDPVEWAALAKEAGMKYMVLTTRHLEGFCLWDTETTDFCATKMGPKRDLVAEYAKACRKAGLKVGFYYNMRDMSYPSYDYRAGDKRWQPYVERIHAQFREILSNYGRVDILWIDQAIDEPLHMEELGVAKLSRMIRRLQPHILVSGGFSEGRFKDFGRFEKAVGSPRKGAPWESCDTFNDNWGYHGLDRNWKSAGVIARKLACCAHLGGNYLLNVGPKPDGTIPAPCVKTLKEIGKWTAMNAEAVYGTDPAPFLYADQTLSVSRGNTAYIFLQEECVPSRCRVKDGCVIAGIGNRVRSASLLADGQPVPFTQVEDRLILRLPARMTDKILPVLKLRLDGKPRGWRRYWWHCGIGPVSAQG